VNAENRLLDRKLRKINVNTYLFFGSLCCNKIGTRHLVCIVKIHKFLYTTAYLGRLKLEAG